MIDDLLSKLSDSFDDLLTKSYSQGYFRALKRTGQELPEEFDALSLRSASKAAAVEKKYFRDFSGRARIYVDMAKAGKLTDDEALDRVYKEAYRLARTASTRLSAIGAFDAMGSDGLVYVPKLRGTNKHVCPPDDPCSRLIAGRVFRADILKASSYTNFGVPKHLWQASVPMHPNCIHYAVPAYKKTVEQLTGMGFTPDNIPDEGVYVG